MIMVIGVIVDLMEMAFYDSLFVKRLFTFPKCLTPCHRVQTRSASLQLADTFNVNVQRCVNCNQYDS